MLVERIRKLCSEQKSSFFAIEKKCGLANGSIRRWDQNTPAVDKVARVAEYLGTTVDDLINGGE